MEKVNTIKPNIVTEESEMKKNAIRIIKGSSFAIIISLILLLVFALLLTYTELSEATMTPVVTTIVGVSILVGSMVSTRKIKKNGILNGSLVGLIYTIILYLASSGCLGIGFSLTIYSFVMLAVSVVTGMIGGIIGVNLGGK